MGKFTGECKFTEDVMVGALTRHTHRWGTDFAVWFEGGERHGEHVWTSTDWQHDTTLPFAEPISIEQGAGFRFACNYANTEQRRLRFGTSATDEMCVLFGTVWNAGPERDLRPQTCAITWVDASGIGHAAEAGFPPASETDAALCSAAAPDDACRACQCKACASVLIECATDADCKPILDCLGSGAENCDEVADRHSSAVGLLFRSQACLRASPCAAACPE
jgi:hypothetical protein